MWAIFSQIPGSFSLIHRMLVADVLPGSTRLPVTAAIRSAEKRRRIAESLAGVLVALGDDGHIAFIQQSLFFQNTHCFPFDYIPLMAGDVKK